MKAKRMKKDEKKYSIKFYKLLIIIVILAIIGIGTYCYINKVKPTFTISTEIFEVAKQNSKTEKNESDEFVKEKEFNGMKVNNISLERNGGISSFSANIENDTNKKFEGREIKITFLHEDLTQITILKTRLDNIEVGQTANIKISTSLNLMDAYTFKIE